MKKFKKTLSALLACTIVSSTLTFASCDFQAFLNGLRQSSPTESSVVEETTGCDVDKIIENLKTQQFKSIALDGTYEETRDYSKAGWSSYDGVHVELKGTVNVPEGDADVYWYNTLDWTNYEYREEDEPAIEKYYTAIYMRDWTPFMGASFLDMITDTKVEFPDGAEALKDPNVLLYNNYLGNIIDATGLNDILESEYGKYIIYAFELMGYDVIGSSAQELANTVFALLNAEIISLADAAGAVTEKEGELVVDLNKTAHTLMHDLENIVLKIDSKTTVADILKDPLIDKYMEAIFRTSNAKDVVSKFLEVYTAFEKDFAEDISLSDMAKILEVISIQPDKDSTAYDYLVKLVTSKSFEELLQSMTGSEFSINSTPITEYVSKDDLYEGFGFEYISATEKSFVVDIPDALELSLENTKWTYVVEDNCLEGLAFGADIEAKEYNVWYDEEDDKVEEVTVMNFKVGGTLDFSMQAATLINADNLQVVIDEVPVFEDGEVRADSEYLWIDNRLEFIAVLKDNKIIDFKLTDEWKERGFDCVYNAQEQTLQITDENSSVIYMLELEYSYENAYCYFYNQEGDHCYGNITLRAESYETVKLPIKECLKLEDGGRR